MGKGKKSRESSNQQWQQDQALKRQERMNKQTIQKARARARVYGDNSWKRDLHLFQQQLARDNKHILDVAGDGNCLFRSICDQIEGHAEDHLRFRTEIVTYMVENREEFEPFVEDDEPFDKYIDRMRRNSCWGGNMEIQAASMIYKVNVIIHQLSPEPSWEVTNWPGARAIELSYHDGSHYASVRLGSPSTGNWHPPDSTPSPPNNRFSVLAGDASISNSDVEVVRNATSAPEDMIVEVLEDMGGDVDATIAYLLVILPTEVEAGSTQAEDSVTEADLAPGEFVPMDEPEQDSADGGGWQDAQSKRGRKQQKKTLQAVNRAALPQQPRAKLSNKQRKRQQQQQKREARQAKAKGRKNTPPDMPPEQPAPEVAISI